MYIFNKEFFQKAYIKEMLQIFGSDISFGLV